MIRDNHTRPYKAALWYAQKGYSVIPVQHNKKPYIPWQQYQTERADTATIQRWWEKWPEANVGIVTGKISDIMVLDADSETGVEAANEFLSETTLTPICQTPSGGQHFYFKYKNGLSNGVRIITDCDFRTDGGYVVAPPSKNGKGEYAWLPNLKISEVSPIEMPEMLFDVLGCNEGLSRQLQSEEEGEKQQNYLNTNINSNIYNNTRIYSSTREGVNNASTLVNKVNISFDEPGRDNTLFHLANGLKRGGMDYASIREYLFFYAEHCNPPFTKKEAAEKIESALKRDELRAKTLTQEIREVIESTSGNFSSTFIYDTSTKSTFLNPAEKRKISAILSRMVKDGYIERVGDQNGVFRRVETKSPRLNIFDVNQEEVKIKLPLGLDRLFIPMPKNIIVVAGAADGGKTAFLLNVCAMNFDCGIPIRYFSSEMGEGELSSRIAKLEGVPFDVWKSIEFVDRSFGFQDEIMPDGINIVDFMEISNNFYEIAGMIRDIYEKLDRGLAFIALQKDDNAKLGRGGGFSKEKPRLYITLDSDPPQGNIAQIVKCKNWRDDTVNPNYMRCTFNIYRGINLRQTTEWARPTKS